MASSVGIVNSALVRINNTTIIAFTDGTKPANLANQLYDKTRERLLFDYPWRFAFKRVKLAQTTNTPASDYDKEYQLPSDWIRTIKVSAFDYSHEGNLILSNENSMDMLYVSNVTDPNIMTAGFREVLSLALAVQFAIGLANSNTLYQLMLKEFTTYLRSLKSSSSMGGPIVKLPVGSWVSTRYG